MRHMSLMYGLTLSATALTTHPCHADITLGSAGNFTALAGSTVTNTGPTVIDSTRTLASSDTATSAPVVTESVTLEQREVMGPNPISIGENECVAWVVASAWNHIDTLAITERFSTVTLTTTETYLTIVRIQVGVGSPATSPTTTTTAPTDAAPATAVESNPNYTG